MLEIIILPGRMGDHMKRPVFLKSAGQRSALFAAEAEKQIEEKSPYTYDTCWLAAIDAARRGGAISREGYTRLRSQAVPDDPELFAPGADCETVTTAAQMRAVQPGCFIVFIADGYHAGGPRRLRHVMVSLGNGEAAGTNNGPVGGRPDWSRVDLAGSLDWTNGMAAHDGTSMEVRVRTIDDANRPSCVVM